MSSLYSFYNTLSKTTTNDESELDIIENLENMDINNENDSLSHESNGLNVPKKIITITEKEITLPRKNSYRKASNSIADVITLGKMFTTEGEISSTKENIKPMAVSLQSLNLKQSNTKFFVLKSDNLEDIEMSYDLNIWCTTITASDKISKAYDNGKNRVILFFSLNLSGKFYGAAELKSDLLPEEESLDVWKAQQKNKRNFKVEWLIYKPVANRVLRHIMVSNTDNKPVTSLKNGYEISSFNKAVEVLDIMFRYVDF